MAYNTAMEPAEPTQPPTNTPANTAAVPAPPRLVLTGYMGAGKSTVGRKLAYRLGYRFMDTDRELIKRYGKSMTQIFKEDGEAAFRQAEYDVLAEWATQPGWVISTGGGTLTRQPMVDLAKTMGCVVYLQADVAMLFERVIFSPKDRPMIDVPNAEQVFTERFKAREPFYTQAHLTVTSDGHRPQRVVDAIIDGLPAMMAAHNWCTE